MKLSLKRLTMAGVAHFLVPALVTVGVGAVGTYALVASHAATDMSIKVLPASAMGDGCGGNATHYARYTTDSKGHTVASKTSPKIAHVGTTQYGPYSSCKCNNGKWIGYHGNIPDSKTNTGCGASTGSGKGGTPPPVVAYNGGNDGCGGNATHYNGHTHVGQTSYGSGSYCHCNNGKNVSYGPAYQWGASNPKCSGSSGSGGGGSGGGGSNCTSGWYTTGASTSYMKCVNGHWTTAYCPSGQRAVSPSSSSGPCYTPSSGGGGGTSHSTCADIHGYVSGSSCIVRVNASQTYSKPCIWLNQSHSVCYVS